MDAVSIILAVVGFALVAGLIVDAVIAHALNRHMEQVDEHLRSILDAHYERIAILIERCRGNDQ